MEQVRPNAYSLQMLADRQDSLQLEIDERRRNQAEIIEQDDFSRISPVISEATTLLKTDDLAHFAVEMNKLVAYVNKIMSAGTYESDLLFKFLIDNGIITEVKSEEQGTRDRTRYTNMFARRLGGHHWPDLIHGPGGNFYIVNPGSIRNIRSIG